MSSNMIPGIPNLRSFLPRLPNLQTANQALTQEEELASLTESQRLALAGAPEVDVERAQQYEELYGPAGLREVAGGLGVEAPESRRGLLETFADYATRLQSASTGFVSGLAGLERRRETFGTGVESGKMLDRPEQVEGGFGLALERFAQGLSGEEKFQAADFGALAYDRETAGVGERFLKSAAGFVLDTALDPLTYVSLGGSVLGRRLGASAVNRVARKNAGALIGQLDEAGKATTIMTAIRKLGTDDAILTNTVRQLNPALAPATGLMNTDDAIRALAQIPGALDNFAMDSLAATSAGMYRSFGPGGLFRYLKNEFGDAGVQFWRTMPNDLKGGLRIRVPFSGLYKRVAGQTGELGGALPTALRLPGTGTGAIAKRLGTEKIGNATRSWFRSKRLLKSGSDNLNGITGSSNMATAEAIYKRELSYQKGIVGEFDPKVDPKLRAVSWKSTEELEDAVRLLRSGALAQSRQILQSLEAARKPYAEGRALDAAAFDDAFDSVLKVDINSFGGEVKTIEDVFGPNPTKVQQLAFQSADNFQMILRDIEAQMQDLSNAYAGFTPNFIDNYWPRIIDDIEEGMRGTRMAGSGTFGNLKKRDNFVAVFNEDGTVKRWMTPREIADQLGGDMFIEDAEKLIVNYAVSMNKFLQEERFFQNLMDRGVLFRSGSEALAEVKDITAASRAWQDGYNAMLAGRSALRGMGRARYQDVVSGAGLTGNALQAMELEAERIAKALSAGRRHGKRLLSQYQHVGEGLWRAGDGTTIRMVMEEGYPMYTVSRTVNGETQYLTAASRWTRDELKLNPFMSLDEAKATADRVLVTDRTRMFIDQIEELRVEFLKDVNRAIANYGRMNRNGLNPLEPGNITPANQDQFFAAIADVINKYGSDAGLRSRRVVAQAYRDPRYGGGRGAAYVPAAGASGPRVRAFWQGRMERLGIFGAETLVEDVRRMFQAQQQPEKFGQWFNDWYRPFYALQKATMTSLRGPGYVARNISGGLWNAYLIGTTARHWRLAAAAGIAEEQAHDAAVKKYAQAGPERATFFREEFRRILKNKLGDRRGNRVADAMQAFEERGLRGRDLTSRTAGVQAEESFSPTAVLRRPLDKDEMTGSQRLTQRITEDWWWAKKMGAAARGSEDFLRFASFLRGVDMYGIDDGGRAAGLLVRATQFDYADLSGFEAGVIKMIMPFYTWTRNNVPLQIKAMIHEPGKVAKAIRLNDALADAFGEEDDPEEPLPQYVRERFGWRVRKDLWSGPMGDAISGGMVVGEPLVDVNRLLGSATGTGVVAGPASMLNWREVANQLNPIAGIAAETITGVERTTGGRLPQQEDVPPWLRVFGVGRDVGEEVPQMSARTLRFFREILPPIGMVERYAAPLIGNERLQRRWYTTLASAIFGLPVSTLDPYQTGAELRAQEERLRGGLQRRFGADLEPYTSYVRRALREGATPDELQIVIRDGLLGGRDIGEVPPEELDETAMVDTLRFMRRIRQMQENGVPRETLDLMMSYFTPRTDAERKVRSGAAQPLTPEQLATLGETPQSVAQMTPDERLDLLRRWIDKNPEWGTALP